MVPAFRRFLVAPIALALLGLAQQAEAHHSYAVFDASKTVSLQGTVVAFEWVNPHSWLRVEVSEAGGSPTVWDLETGAPGVIARKGLRPKDLKPGDKVTVTLNPRRDGSPGGGLIDLTLADGRSIALR